MTKAINTNPENSTMRIGPKLLIAFLVVASLVAVVSYLTATIFTETLSKTEQICKGTLTELVGASEMSLALQVSQVAAQDLVTNAYHSRRAPQDSENVAANEARVQQAVEDNLNAFAKWLYTNSRVAEQQGDIVLLNDVKANIRQWLEKLAREYTIHAQLMNRFLQLKTKEDIDQANNFLKTQLKAHYDKEMFPLVRAYQSATEFALSEKLAATEQALIRAKSLSSVITIAAFFLAITFGLHIAHSISKPAHALKEAALRIGHGDLTTKLPAKSSGELGVLADTFSQMVAKLKMTTVSKSYVDNIIHSMNEFLIVIDASGGIETVNKTTLHELGYSAYELIGNPIGKLIRTNEASVMAPPINWQTLDLTGEHSLLTKDGRTIPAYWSSSELRDQSGVIQGMVYVGKDMTEWKRVEAQLRTSLSEKNVLLKEVHHRVKNNLQIICSLLRLQARRSREPATQAMFHESDMRIRSMALIHEQLYRSRDIAQIEFAEYLHSLIKNLQRSYGQEGHRIAIRIQVDPVHLSLDEAIPCGLLINELVSNAIKHAFPAEREGTIWIIFETGQGGHTLTVRDDGIGLSNSTNTQTLGLQLVHALVKQLHGELQLDRQKGTCFVITFESLSNRYGAVVEAY